MPYPIVLLLLPLLLNLAIGPSLLGPRVAGARVGGWSRGPYIPGELQDRPTLSFVHVTSSFRILRPRIFFTLPLHADATVCDVPWV